MRSDQISSRQNAAPEAGFSLLELLVVITIIAVLSATALLSVRLGPGQSPAAKMDALARAIRYLQAEALYAERSFGFSLSEEGWEVLVLDEPQGLWERRAEGALHATGDWGNDPQIRIEIEGRPVTLKPRAAEEPAPDVFLLPSGETTPFQVQLISSRGEQATCDLQLYGELACDFSG